MCSLASVVPLHVIAVSAFEVFTCHVSVSAGVVFLCANSCKHKMSITNYTVFAICKAVSADVC